MAAENPLANKSSKKKLKKLKHIIIIPLKAKEATIYGLNLFPKDKSTFNLKRENNRIGRQVSDSWIRLTQKRKSEVNYICNVTCVYIIIFQH
jgi:hypothetical protein